MRVRFLAPAEMRDSLGAVEYSAAPGQVLDLRDDQAHRWIKRGKAEAYTGESEAAEQAVEEQQEETRPARRNAKP